MAEIFNFLLSQENLLQAFYENNILDVCKTFHDKLGDTGPFEMKEELERFVLGCRISSFVFMEHVTLIQYMELHSKINIIYLCKFVSDKKITFTYKKMYPNNHCFSSPVTILDKNGR